MEIKIKPTRMFFYKDEDSFGIYACEVHPDHRHEVSISKFGTISIKGVMPKLDMGSEYTATVKEDTDSQYAGSYLLEGIRQDKPTTIEEQKKFFEMILTENQVNNIFEVYEGQDIITMIQDDTFDYGKVKGLGDKTYEKMKEKVLNSLDMSDLLVFLNQHGIKYNMVKGLVKKYKNPQIVIDKINTNPYVLTEVKGIGFIKADEIAKAVGYSMTSPHRIDSCLRYIIGEENANGHSWITRKQLLNRAVTLLNISKTLIDDRLEADAKGIKNVDDERFTSQAVYDAECLVAQAMVRFKTQSSKVFTEEEINTFLDEYCAKESVELEANQRQFFHDWNENNICFLIGGGGMGKSWLQRILLDLVAKKNLRTALLAPTGKASKVMTGYTGKEASTIHRKAGVFDNEENASKDITEDVIIVDESSMCDIFILSKLFKSIKNYNARILFVGDDFQLPSVGVGNFLYDSIHSECVKISKLKKVFRQAEGGILDVATKVRHGETFLDSGLEGRHVKGKDCVFWLADQEYIRDGILVNYKKVIKRFNPDDVVILSPTKKGKLGTVELNKEIQKIVNPKSATKKEKTYGKDEYATTYRVGDSVMNTTNTYAIETVNGGTADIFNGDAGKIVDIDEAEKVIVVDFEGVVVKMKFDAVLTSLLHCWATTIHKSQGSQYKVVMVVVDKSMKYQLNANLIYTGFSRAKDYMLVLGQSDAINHGIKKFANMERRSFLQELLQKFNNAPDEAVALYNDIMEQLDEGEEDCAS